MFKHMLRSASGTAVLQAVSTGGTFLVAILLARLLGSEAFGLYAFSYTWAGLLGVVATLGADRYLVRSVSVYEVKHDWRLMKGLLRRTYQLVSVTSVSIAIGGCIVAALWLSSSLRGPFCVAMLLVPLTALTLLRQGAMQAFGRVVRGQLPEFLIRPVLILAGVLLLGWLGSGLLSPTTALWAAVVAAAVAFAVGTVFLLRALPDELRSAGARYSTREWMSGSLSMMLVAGAALLNNYVGILVAGTLGGPETAGVYAVVQNSAGVLVLVLLAANMPLAPVVARLYARGEKQELERTTEGVARGCLLVSAPVCVVFAIFPDVFLGIFGEDFRVGSTALAIVAVAQLVNAAAGPTGNVMMMTGHERIAAKVVGIAAVVNLVIGVALVPSIGVTGSAIAYAASLMLWNTVLVVSARRRIGVNVTAFRRLSVSREHIALCDRHEVDTE